MFPRWGFTAYPNPSFVGGGYLDTNPYTKSLDKQSFLCKEIVGGKWCRGNFYHRPKGSDFYIYKDDLAHRDFVERVFLVIFTWLPMVIYNLFTGNHRKNKKVISYGLLPFVVDVLSKEQIEKARDYYNNHKGHVDKIMQESNVACDVSESEDKNDPRLWKPGHWLWFFGMYETN